jgi:mannitol/fructose-specific phosphotransferase system IIA component (Ntr-type)
MQPIKITFKNEHIIPQLESPTALQAIGELVDHLVSVGTLLPEAAGPIAQAIRQRETSMSTGVGFGLAVPHASTPLTTELIVAFGRSHNGIDFDSVDGQAVRLVVLVIAPAREKEKHFLTLSSISRLLHDRDIRLALEQAGDGDSISGILNGNQPVAARPAPLQESVETR